MPKIHLSYFRPYVFVCVRADVKRCRPRRTVWRQVEIPLPPPSTIFPINKTSHYRQRKADVPPSVCSDINRPPHSIRAKNSNSPKRNMAAHVVFPPRKRIVFFVHAPNFHVKILLVKKLSVDKKPPTTIRKRRREYPPKQAEKLDKYPAIYPNERKAERKRKAP